VRGGEALGQEGITSYCKVNWTSTGGTSLGI